MPYKFNSFHGFYKNVFRKNLKFVICRFFLKTNIVAKTEFIE